MLHHGSSSNRAGVNKQSSKNTWWRNTGKLCWWIPTLTRHLYVSMFRLRLERAATFHGENMGNEEHGNVHTLALQCWDHDRRRTCTSCHGNTVPGLAETLWSCTAAEQVIEYSLIPECSNVYTCCIIFIDNIIHNMRASPVFMKSVWPVLKHWSKTQTQYILSIP